MCIKTQTSRFTGSSWAQLERLAAALQEADAVLVGAGAGLSTSAGFAYSGERFRRYFGDFEAAYGFHDMYSGGFYPFPTLVALGLLEPVYLPQPLLRPAQAGISKPAGAGKGERYFCAHHQCGPLLSKGRV